MNRFFVALIAVAVTLAVLIYSAVTATAKSVVTVHELFAAGSARQNIRLGARVAEGEIRQVAEPERRVTFSVRDISPGETRTLPVAYNGIMPDTLKVGRDVILEGNFDGAKFEAKNLVTQCPSKYVPPNPGASKAGSGNSSGSYPDNYSGGSEGK